MPGMAGWPWSACCPGHSRASRRAAAFGAPYPGAKIGLALFQSSDARFMKTKVTDHLPH
jgi:hypothetical protein